jgi:ABC-type phosphate transport system permease subunit
MTALNIVAGVCNMVTGLLLIVICAPLLRGSIGRNQAYGFRFRRSFQTEEDWQRINRYGARWMIIWSIILIGIGIAAFFLPIRDSITVIVWTAGPVTIVPLIVIIQTYIYANRR